MITTAKLILDMAKTIWNTSGEIKKLQKEKREEVAVYLDSIADALSVAAKAFRTEGRPWDRYFQVEIHLEGLRQTTKGVLDEKTQSKLESVLETAYVQDKRLLQGSRERVIIDAVTIHPDPMHAIWEDGNLKNNPIAKLSEAELLGILDKEISQIEEAAGLFRAYAVETRAS